MSIDSRFFFSLRTRRGIAGELLGALYGTRPTAPVEGVEIFTPSDDFLVIRGLRP